jgi:Family of unknown function (DUF6152)
VRFLPALCLAACGAFPIWAHHSLEAEYDDSKRATLRGTVTDYDWSNPHVHFSVDVAGDGGKITSWDVEAGSTIQMRAAGWSRESVRVGEAVTIEGSLARDGSGKALGKSVTLADGKRLTWTPGALPAQPRRETSGKPTPRWPDGHVRLGRVGAEAGYWAYPSRSSLLDITAGEIAMNSEGLLRNIADAAKVAPFLPWAKGLYEYRQRHLLKDDPMAACLPPGGPRQFQAPYGLEILEQPERQRVFILSGGGNRNWRLIPMDGRELPDMSVETAGFFGFSVGRWEQDTLVAETVGLNERFWFSNGGLPHTESARLTERISRPDFDTLRYEVTVDDPGAYTKPWSGHWTITEKTASKWIPNGEMFEYICEDAGR